MKKNRDKRVDNVRYCDEHLNYAARRKPKCEKCLKTYENFKANERLRDALPGLLKHLDNMFKTWHH